MTEDQDEFADAAQLGIIESRIEAFEEELASLEEDDVERRQELEEQLEIWREARNQVHSDREDSK